MKLSPRGWTLYFAVWLVFGLIYSQALATKPGISTAGALWIGLADIAPAAVLGCFVWRRSARFPFGTSAMRLLASHLVAAFTFSSLWLAASWARLWLSGRASSRVVPISHAFAAWHLAEGLVVYAVIAGIAHAVRSEQERREQLDALTAAETLRARAELAALRGQLNPHFFFNTLHSVTQLIKERPREAIDAVERLANLFRYVLASSQDGGDERRLGDEVAFTRDYLALEAIRLGSRLRVIERVEGNALNCVVPTLTLQPLVENAINHAVATRRDGGTIEIRARRRDDRLHIEVADDGPGADANAMRDGRGVGLRAVRERLKALHAESTTMEVVTSIGAGFEVHIALPADDGVASRAS